MQTSRTQAQRLRGQHAPDRQPREVPAYLLQKLVERRVLEEADNQHLLDFLQRCQGRNVMVNHRTASNRKQRLRAVQRQRPESSAN